MQATKVLYTTRQAAEYLTISRSLFLQLVREGKLPAGLKISERAVSWHIDDLNAYIDRCREERQAAQRSQAA